MVAAGRPRETLRLERTESSRVLWALLLSGLLHLVSTGTYYAGKKLHWWDEMRVPLWMQSPKFIPVEPRKAGPQAARNQEPPMVFVQVSPHQAASAPPVRNTPFYSTRDSQAANPSPSKSLDTPKIEGSQEQVIRTEDIPRPVYTPLQPLAPEQPVPPPRKPEPEPEPEPEEPPQPAQAPGDLALQRPDTRPPPPAADPGQSARQRPANLRQALAQQNQNRLAGEKMKQEGGVARRREFASLDAKASPFAEYDQALILAIQSRWYALLDERQYASDSRGRVMLRFNLHPDGRVSELTIAENGAGEMLGLLCQKAVLDPQPYAPWPVEMRKIFGPTRHIQFTFYYN